MGILARLMDIVSFWEGDAGKWVMVRKSLGVERRVLKIAKWAYLVMAVSRRPRIGGEMELRAALTLLCAWPHF